MKSAWDVLPISIIEKSWSKILHRDDREFDEEHNITLANLAQRNEIDAYRNEINTVLLLSKLTPNAVLSNDDIKNLNYDYFMKLM